MEFACIILTGGKSRRMGQPKQFLLWEDRTFLEQAVETAQTLGCGEILLSGQVSFPGTRTVPDLYEQTGPLGGLCSCLQQAHTPLCLVIPVDLPQLPLRHLKNLLTHAAAQPDIDCWLTICSGQPQPLVSLWRTRCQKTLASLLLEKRFSVIDAARQLRMEWVPFQGDPEYLASCNTPQEYQQRLEWLAQRKASLEKVQ